MDRVIVCDVATSHNVVHAVPPGEHHIVVEYLLAAPSAVQQEIVLAVAQDAKLWYLLVVTAPAELSKKLSVELAGRGAQATLHGVVLGTGAQKVKLTSVTLHTAPHTSARITVNGVLNDHAELDYDGLIKILPAAQLTDSYLASHTLLLGQDCRANAIPSLEIEANEVKCSHEVTVAPIDEEQLFYLSSRGLDEADAEHLITNGFLLPPIEALPDMPLKKQLMRRIGGDV